MSGPQTPIGPVGVAPESRPRLCAKARLRWDAREGRYFLLYPERGLRLNDTAAAIVKMCTGAHTVAAIARALGGDAPEAAERALREAADFVESLRRRGLVELVTGP